MPEPLYAFTVDSNWLPYIFMSKGNENNNTDVNVPEPQMLANVANVVLAKTIGMFIFCTQALI